MAWLGTWANRRKITIDNTNIDSDLTHFPVPIVLGTSVGQSSQDLSDIFDKIGSNSLKIAITKADGDTQIYGEIEVWDDTNEKAVIWVSKSDLVLSNSAVTELYLYFDAAQSDNTTYIGEVGGTPAQSVWDSNFKAVHHMAQDPSGTAPQLLDSTSNSNDGTSGGSMTSGDLIDGRIGKAIDFDGTDDYVNIQEDSSLKISTNLTLSALVKSTDLTTNTAARVLDFSDTAGGLSYGYRLLWTQASATFRALVGDGSALGLNSSKSFAIDTAYLITMTYDGSTLKIYVDELAPDTVSGTKTIGYTGVLDATIGNYRQDSETALHWDGPISEVQISNTTRSTDWIKATNYALKDDLLTFTATETVVPVPTAEMTMAASLILKISPAIPTAGMTMVANVDDPITATLITIPAAEMTMVASLNDPSIGIAPSIPTAKMTMTARVGIKETVQIPTAEMIMVASVSGISLQIPILTAEMIMAASLGPVVIFDHARADVYYIFTLTGAEDSLADIEIPMTSFQTRMRDGDPTFLSVVIPDETQAAAITARPNGTLKIDMAYKLDGVFIQRETIVQADFESVRTDEGEASPITLSGHKTETFPGKALTLSTSIYRSTIDGKIRHRLAEPNINLRPGDTVTIGSDTFVVDLITYFMSVQSKTMEISEA